MSRITPRTLCTASTSSTSEWLALVQAPATQWLALKSGTPGIQLL
jgi:hypothetical protein